jgi:hypothetical protein
MMMKSAPRPWNWHRIGSFDRFENHALSAQKNGTMLGIGRLSNKMHWHFSPFRNFFSFRTAWHVERGQGLAKAAKSALRDGLAELQVENQGLHAARTGASQRLRTGTVHQKSVPGRILNIAKAAKAGESTK